MQKKLGFVVVLAMAGTLLFSGVSLAGFCSDTGRPDGCIKTSDLANRSILAQKMKKSAVNSFAIKDGSIKTQDLANDAVTSAKMDADIALGDATDSGSLVVQASNFRDYLGVSGSTAAGSVRVGQSGATGMDVDLLVYDPTENDFAAYIDASLALLRLGSGSAANPGDDGDIYVEDGEGAIAVNIDGNSAALYLGVGSAATPGNDGDIIVRNNVGANTFVVDGQSGNATNSLGSNGLVKAWARINSNGTVAGCYRCSTSASLTYRSGIGTYRVDFTPLATNIRSRPKSIVVKSNQASASYSEPTDASQIVVYIRRLTVAGAPLYDRPFEVIIY